VNGIVAGSREEYTVIAAKAFRQDRPLNSSTMVEVASTTAATRCLSYGAADETASRTTNRRITLLTYEED